MSRVAASKSLVALARRIEVCRLCPRLVEHREEVALTKRRAYANETYWGRPVAGFGDPSARIVVVGLAPGAHGANRTGRPFTGDRSGEFLYAALHRMGLANQATSTRRDDGLMLRDVFVTLPVRCVPPDNKPSREEIDTCSRWFEKELALLSETRAVVALGRIAFDSVMRLSRGEGEGSATRAKRSPAAFAHGAVSEIAWPLTSRRRVVLVASYHVSQQNTQTGRLTPAMFDDVLKRAIRAAQAVS
ncbi:MAG: uracil-DNA glycosylase [Polyangiaceae bacterium]|nr:uracil-DNA glycosylase [Polyangiaceae bacterium]